MMGVDAEVELYVKSGVDGERMGACPFCQRVFMALLVKAKQRLLKFKVITVNPAKPPPEFGRLGLKHLPAIIHIDEGYDALDDIINYIDGRFPGGVLEFKNSEADLATKDFFSSFCFYIKAVKDDPSKMTSALQKLDSYLEKTYSAVPNGNLNCADRPKQFMCGPHPCHLDCEVLPKLQHLRVAAKALKDYDIPMSMKGVWRYLYTAYCDDSFIRTCPCDQEILLHWHDRRETAKLSAKMHSAIAKEKPKFSTDIPVHASVVKIE